MLPQVFESGTTLFTGLRSVSTGAYTTVAGDDGLVIDVDTTSAAITVTALAAATAGAGYRFIVRKKTSDANAVTLSGPSVGETTLRTQGDVCILVSNGTTYYSMMMAGPDITAGVARHGDGTEALPSLTFEADLDTGFYRPGSNIVACVSNGVEIWRTTATRNLLIGDIGAGRAIGGSTSGIQAEDTGGLASISQVRNSNDTGGPVNYGGKSRATAVLGVTAVQSGDNLYRIGGAGADGTDLATLAVELRMVCDGAVSGNRVPGRLGIFVAAGTGDDDIAEVVRIHSTGQLSALATTDATSATTGAVISAGSIAAVKNIVGSQGLGLGVTSTATAAGTTVLTAASDYLQIFTGSTTQTITLPAANALGAGVAQILCIKNRSTGNLTVNRAGSDTIDGGTTLTMVTNDAVTLASNGVSEWVLV